MRVVRRCWHRWHVEREVRPSEERVGSSRADTCSDAKSCRSFGHQNRDNQAFEKSAEKGRSRAQRINLLLKRLFVLMVSNRMIYEFYWLSTHVNSLADALSRARIDGAP